MDIRFDRVRHVEVDNKRYVCAEFRPSVSKHEMFSSEAFLTRHIDTTTSKIGCHENIGVASAQAVERFFSLLLILVRVQGGCPPLQGRIVSD